MNQSKKDFKKVLDYIRLHFELCNVGELYDTVGLWISFESMTVPALVSGGMFQYSRL